MFTYSPQNKKNCWNYSNNPLQKFGNPWFLILCEVTWMIHDCSFVLCWLFMSPLFVLNSWTEHCSSDKSSTFCRFCSFPAFLHIWTLSSSDCMILRSIFSHWGQLRDSNTTIKKGSNIHWCSRRKHDALRAGCWKLLNRMKISNFFLLLKYIFFSIYYCPSEATEDTCMFPGRQIKYNLPWSSNSKSVHPPALNASCVLLEHQWMFWTFFNSCVWVHQLSSVWKDGSQNHTVTAGKGSNMQKCWKTAESTERGGFVWRTVLSSTVQNKQGTHEQPTQNKRTVVDHPGNLTQY